jgi:hypothetical protein
MSEPLNLGFNLSHRFLGQFHTRLINLRDQRDHRKFAPLPHRLGKLHHRLNLVQDVPIPMVFQDSPDSLNGIVFTVIGRVIGQS